MMIIDLLLALIALGGAAYLGYRLGNLMATKSYGSTIQQQQQALSEAQQALSVTNEQLDHCTKRRRVISRKMADLTAQLESQGKVNKTSPGKAAQTVQPVERPKKTTSQDEVLKRIEAKAEQIDFERIGRSAAHEKDDLKQINGVGHFIEKKLNALGIYTFAQIANFNQEDEVKVNEAIEFFPGRIKRDRWVKQAKALQAAKSIE